MNASHALIARIVWLLLFGLCGHSLHAAPIPGLFGTGLNEDGELLGAELVDPHYTITASPDAEFPGPEAFTLAPGFPVGPWVDEGPKSRWIAPQASQATGNEPGTYTYTTTFSLFGLDPTTAEITGLIGTDDGLVAVRLNGEDVLGIVSAGFASLREFIIPAGSPFVEGINTLEFDVSNGGTAVNPTGLRLDMTGIATGPNEAPAIRTQPESLSVLVGESASFQVQATGTPPLSYQWHFANAPIGGATGATNTLTDVTTNDTGDYVVVVSNSFGSVTSTVATLTVLIPFPGIYNTGVNDSRAPLAEGEVDPHYSLIVNAEFPDSTNAYVQAGIPAPPWVLNSAASQWIGPFTDPNGAAGDYTYELLLDLTGYDPASAFLLGSWATDDAGSLFLNHADTGFRSAGFAAFSEFHLTNGFVSGINSLQFRLQNSGLNPTGLRVERLRGSADEATGGETAPRIVTAPRGSTNVVTTDVTFVVVADGTPPFSYQWSRNNTELPAATNSTLTFAPVTATDAGSYSVRISNTLGSTNSSPVELVVIQPQFGVFNTGVDANGVVLETGAIDPHYVLLTSADAAFPGPLPYVTAGPIPPWWENDGDSAWISARPDSSANIAPGSYRYRLIFSIDNPAEVETAAITGNVGTDDGNGGVFLNGKPIAFGGSGFSALTPLEIPAGSGFVAGLNTLDFVIINGGADVNPSGLRVEDLVLEGVTVTRPVALSIERSGESVRVSWPVAAAGFVLENTTALPGGWAATPAPVLVEGDENVVTVTPTATSVFFRLRQ